MKASIQIIFCLALAFTVLSQTDQCNEPNYIIPFEQLDQAFDQGIDAVRSQQNLVALIQNPNEENVRNYLLSLAPFSAALFVLAAVSFALLIVMAIQIICFNTCGKECCGNQLTTTTYNLCCMRTMTACFVFLSFLLMCLSIAAIIVNSDLQYAIDFTSCNTENIVDETYNGNDNQTIPWSGVSNFGDDINFFAVNIQNIVPSLKTYFSTSNSNYNNLIDTSSATTPYNLSQTYNCQNASGFTITCPFADATKCSSPYQAEFTLQFCDPSVTTSAETLITDEMATNSSVWRQNIINLGNTLGNISINQQSIDTLTNDIESFTNSIVDYEQTLQNGLSDANSVNYAIEIALYVLFSFLLATGLLGITSTCCVFYCNSFKCNCFTYLWCFIYSIFALLLFVAAGLFLSGSFFIYDTCSAYPYYFTNQTHFNELTFASDQVGEIFETCFFDGSQSMFTAFQDSTVLTDFTALNSQYVLAVPASSFSTVVTTIEDQLFKYGQNPNTVVIANVNSTQQPQQALDQANTFANFSATDSGQSCNLTRDRLVYSTPECYPYLVGQDPPSNSCVVLNSDLSALLTNRTDLFDDNNCSSQGVTYQDNANALFNYRTSIQAIVDDLYSIPDSPTNPLQEYEDNYFSYYSNVQNFFNDGVTNTFQAFFDPYDRLYEGSSCGFITTSMDGIINIGCNQLFPYFNILSALTITISVVVFILFILAYFLTTRFQFYEFLDGNLDNWGEQSYKTKDLPGYNMDSTRNYNQQLMTNNTGRY